MCHLNPILNGNSNLCEVTKILNTKKKMDSHAPDVRVYMQRMTHYMRKVLIEVHKISEQKEHLKDDIINFVTLLKQQLETLYELTL